MTRPTRRASRVLAGLGVAVIAVALGLVAAAPAYAASFTVTNAADTGAGSLRQAIIGANGSPGSTIAIQAGLVIDMSTFANQAVTASVVVTGDASNPPTIIGPKQSAIFQVTGLTASIEVDNVTMQASTTVTSGDAITTAGGPGSVTLTNDSFLNFPSPAVELELQTGDLTATHCTFSGNAATAADSDGGAIIVGSVHNVTITGSTFDHNHADNNGGAIFLNAANRVNISGSTFDQNSAGLSGGAIGITAWTGSSTWTGNTFTGNTAAAGASHIGGAAFSVSHVPPGVTFIVDKSTFSGNTAPAQSASTSGAVGYINDIGGTVQVTNSTMTGNHFTGVVPLKTGFGIDLAVGSTEATGEFDVVQSTFDESGPGKDLLSVNTNLGLVRIASSTLTGPGVLIVSNNPHASAGAVEVRDSIAITTSSADAIDVADAGAEISYSITSSVAGPQLVDLGSTQFDVTDPQIGGLGNNGGPTQTRLPLTGSPAIDAGDPTFTVPLTDQRGAGFPRITNGRVDIGAVEVAGTTATTPTLAATGVNPLPTAWTASTAFATGALLLGAVLLTRRRRNTAQQNTARR